MKRILILLTLAIITCSSCKKWQHKYPEDTERTKLTPEERLTGKYWKLSKTTFNGMDYTDSVKNTIGDYEIYFSLQEDTDRKTGRITTNIEGTFGTIWSFTLSDKSISISRMQGLDNNYPLVPCYYKIGGPYPLYSILQLSTSFFKIQYTNNENDTTITNEFTL